MKFERTGTEIIGDFPHRETYDVYEGSGKMMELAFFENDNRYEIYIENLKDGQKVSGETTELFRMMLKNIQKKSE